VIEGNARPITRQCLADGAELHAHLGPGGERTDPLGQPGPVQRVEQQQVGIDGRLGRRGIGGVLTEVVEADQQPVLDQGGCGADRARTVRAADEALHDRTRDRGRGDRVFEPTVARGAEDRRTEHGCRLASYGWHTPRDHRVDPL
jgi:hypothetical protein